MIKFSYFWVMIVVAFSFFFVGAYKNIVSKIAYVLWLNDPDRDGKANRGTPVGFPFPKKSTIINEALIQKTIKERSFFMWVRHLLIFFGFVSLFLFDGLYYLSIKLFQLAEGFRIELAAAEPLLADPTAILSRGEELIPS